VTSHDRPAISPQCAFHAGKGKRSLVVVAIRRYKVLIGRSLRARTLPAQKVEATVGCKVITIMTGLGMPVSQRVA
jgi:hypothetical protein